MGNRKKTRNKKLSRKLGNDQGILVIHGVGNQKEGKTLQKFGGSLRDRALRYPGSDLLYGTDEEIRSGAKKEIKVSLGSESKYDNLYIREVHWAKNYGKKLKNKTLWVLFRMHLIALLLFFDIRDEKFIKNPLSNKSILGMVYRFYARFLILVTLVVFTFSIFRCLFTISMPLGLILVVGFILFIEKSKWNLSNDVRVAVSDVQDAASLDNNEKEGIIKEIDKGVKKFPRSVRDITIVAHSQGGYLTHQYLIAKNYNPPKKIKHFVGVGSGLGAIHIISLTQGVKNLLVSWFIFIVIALIFLFHFAFVWSFLENIFMHIYNFIYNLGWFILSGDPNFVGRLWMIFIGLEVYLLRLDPGNVFTVIIFSLILFIPIAKIKKYWYKNIERIPENITWEEYSSARDIVGRVTPIIAWGVPYLTPKVVGLLGGPLSVHTKYFNDSSVMPSVLISRLYGEEEVDKYEKMQKYLYTLTIRQKYMSSASAVLAAVLLSYGLVYDSKLYGNSYIAVISCILVILFWKVCFLLLILAMRALSWIIVKVLEYFIGFNKISINFGMYGLTDNKFSSYVSGDSNYIEQFSPVSFIIRRIIGGLISVISAVLIITSHTYLQIFRNDYPGLANVFFMGVIYFFVGLCIILGYSFETLKGVFGGIVGLAILLVTVSSYPYFPHISLLYSVILFTVIVYAWIGWYKIEKIKSVNVGSGYP
ncbi:hypothetical protein HMPREF2609_05185 [Rothia sp. HMSC058E10]|uniref:hypothetical protein n=1 Tax=Rothia sp. HMSC058E10 TaxID=1715088 RepID=UPI0008A44651|nr:hypothetical protein [Rothia sp. HMSC058E10]OFN18056.1 hypothetical protein HMPREF2609_05185 [Rothia sp. HMSC058E10]